VKKASSSVVPVGVFGVGSLGEHHARIYRQMTQARLVGVYDAHAERAAAVAEKYGTRAFATPEALAAEVRAASVVAPTHLHHAVAAPLLERGLHLLVEKPIAATTAEAESLVALARSKNLILQVGHVERFNPVLDYLERLGGAPRFIEAHRLAPYPAPRAGGLPPRGTEVSVVLDLMIHDLEVILHLVDAPVTQIHAVGVPVLSPTADIANVRLSFANGCVANVTASRISQERLRKIRVFFSDSYLSLDYMNQAGAVHRRTPQGIQCEKVPIEREEPLALELESFIRCVDRHDDPVVSGEQAARALRLAMDIHERMRQGPS